LNRLLTKDPKKRPEAAQALTHPWLKVSSDAHDGYDPYLQAISDEVASNLAKFAASNKLQRAFMHLASSFLNKNEMQKMLSMFNRLNADHHTPLPASQMTALLAKGRSQEEAEQFRKTVEVRHHFCCAMLCRACSDAAVVAHRIHGCSLSRTEHGDTLSLSVRRTLTDRVGMYGCMFSTDAEQLPGKFLHAPTLSM
jgi:hypothetical protein